MTEEEEEQATYPPQVQAFHNALYRFKAIREVNTGLKFLADFGPEVYSFPGEFGDMPHALLLRTNGGLEDECWANTEFELEKDEAGWLTLEFLSWWVRDHSRAGDLIQLRPMALPPKAYEVQLGETLKFIIDHFAVCPGDTPDEMLALFDERAESLNDSIELYDEILAPICQV